MPAPHNRLLVDAANTVDGITAAIDWGELGCGPQIVITRDSGLNG